MTATDSLATAGASFVEATAVVHLHNLHVTWGMDLILHGTSLDIPACQTATITGLNGSSKSTTPEVPLDTTPVTSGDAQLLGRPISARRRAPRSKTDYVPQRTSSDGAINASAIRVVQSGLLGSRRLWALPGDTAKAMSTLKRVDTAHRTHPPPNILSGGQAQCVLIARALVRRPEPLITDRPMAEIDAAS